MDDKKVYLVKAVLPGTPQDQILGVALNKEDAYKIQTDALNNNPGITIDKLIIEEYFFKKELKIIDI